MASDPERPCQPCLLCARVRRLGVCGYRAHRVERVLVAVLGTSDSDSEGASREAAGKRGQVR